MTPPTDIALMKARLDALWRCDARGRMVARNQWDAGVAPRFHLARTQDGHVCRYHASLPAELVEALEQACADTGDPAPLDAPPAAAERCLTLLAEHRPIESTWLGPSFVCTSAPAPAPGTVAINADNATLLERGLDDWLPDVPHRHPFIVTVREGRAVAVCASVRITQAVHEAGVETLPAYRRRGCARAAVAAWANAVRALGVTPCYSTAWSNAASINLARSLGFELLGADFHVY